MKKVNLFLVGAAKSGTTSLAAKLASEKAVSVGLLKEPFFFVSSHGVDNEKDYLSGFDADAKYWLDASTGYLYDESVPRRLSDYNPEAKIVIVLRNPIHFSVSYWEYMTANGSERHTFEEAISLQERERRKSKEFVESCDGWAPSYLYLERGCFSLQVERYLKVFQRHQIHISLFEDLISDDRVVKSIYDFLGLTLPSDLSLPRENVTGRPNKMVRWIRFSKVLNPIKIVYRDMFPLSFRAVIRRSLEKKAMKQSGYEKYNLTSDKRDELTRFFSEDVRRLKLLLPDVDFSVWSEFD